MNVIKSIVDSIQSTEEVLTSLCKFRLHDTPTEYNGDLGIESDITSDYIYADNVKYSEVIKDKLALLDSLTKYTVEFSIGWGTLLGYHRDGDVIRWDDDVDVIMPISVLRRLREEHPDKFILYRGTYRYCNTDVSGLRVKKSESEYVPNYIDIFPIGRDVDAEMKRELKKYVITTWHNFSVSTWKYRLTRLPYFFMSKKYKDRKFEEMLFNALDKPAVNSLSAFFLYGKSFHVGCQLDTHFVQFAGINTLVPKDPELIDKILRSNYGDYTHPKFKSGHKCEYITSAGDVVSNLVPVRDTLSPYREYEILTNLTIMKGVCIGFKDKYLVMTSRKEVYNKLRTYLQIYYSPKIVLVHTPNMRVY